MSPKTRNRVVIVVIAVIMILLGLWLLLTRFFGVAFAVFFSGFGLALSLLCSFVIIAAGVILIISEHQKARILTEKKRLYRSTSNKKIAGICAGIAAFLNIDPVIVRGIALVLGFISFYLIVPLYIILWIVIPPDTQIFDTWV